MAAVDIIVPPLTARLIARPDIAHPLPNYARLCTSFVVAKVLQHGGLDIAHFRGDGLADPETHRLARLVRVHPDCNSDPNAMVPQEIRIGLQDGRCLTWHCGAMLANPGRPLSRSAQLEKFRRCWQFAAERLSEEAAETLIRMVSDLESLADLRALTRLLVPQGGIV